MKNGTLILACLFVTITLNAQTYEWSKSFGGAFDDYGKSISTDADGNVYTAGFFQGTVDFDPGAGTVNLTAVGASDVFVQKMDASGNFLWAKSFGGVNNDIGSSISTDASGNIYTTGVFQGTVDFDPGSGIVNLTTGGIFVQKMDTSGNFLWAKSFGEGSFASVNSISTDASGNVYTTGNFDGTTDFDPGAGTANLSATLALDIFVQKMDASGNFLWAKSFESTGVEEFGNSISIDASGNVYTTGQFGGTADFDPGSGTANLTAAGLSNVFVQKMDASGNFLWAKSVGGNGFDYGNSISTDASGNVYTTGHFEETVDFDPGTGTLNLTASGFFSNMFIQKLDASGNLIWAKSVGGNGVDDGRSIFVDAEGNSYITGYFEETVDFDPGSGTVNLTAAGYSDMFILKLDDSGNFLWVQSFGGSSFVDAEISSSIRVDNSGNVYTIGNFEGTTDFNPGSETDNLSSSGLFDIFVQKLSQGTVGIPVINDGIKISAFPNPSNGLIQIEFEQALSNIDITITDVNGRIVYTKHLDTGFNTPIEITGTTGIYFLKIKTPQEQKVIKLIKK